MNNYQVLSIVLLIASIGSVYLGNVTANKKYVWQKERTTALNFEAQQRGVIHHNRTVQLQSLERFVNSHAPNTTISDIKYKAYHDIDPFGVKSKKVNHYGVSILIEKQDIIFTPEIKK